MQSLEYSPIAREDIHTHIVQVFQLDLSIANVHRYTPRIHLRDQSESTDIRLEKMVSKLFVLEKKIVVATFGSSSKEQKIVE